MPKGLDWFNFIFVNLGFLAQILAMYYFVALGHIDKNWAKYRCNPIFMPLSNNMQEDFQYCIQTSQINFMGYLLAPLNFILSGLTEAGGEVSDTMNNVRYVISNIRTFLASVTGNLFGVFLNIITEFQKLTIGINDMVGKVVGSMVTLMYVMDGSLKTMQSTWNGPPGQMVRALCFHPSTMVKTTNGTVYPIGDIPLGSVLENGSVVDAVLTMRNKMNEGFFIMGNVRSELEQKEEKEEKEEKEQKEEKEEKEENIYVTGGHFVLNSTNGEFVHVRDHPLSKAQSLVKSDILVCLITSDHKIPIGDYIFWDWDDDELELNYLKAQSM